ncbi:MAG: DUF2306 domain-containing protein [Pseudomonadota bacterium]
MSLMRQHLVSLAALAVAVYAGLLLALPEVRPGFVDGLFARLPLATALHLSGGVAAVLIGAYQFYPGLRQRHLVLHRWLGRVYVFAIATAGVAGLIMALGTPWGVLAQSGFSGMAIAWLITTTVAFLRIRTRDIHRHRQWMIRSYAVTLAAVTLRLYLGLMVLLGIAFRDGYPWVAWLSWVPNLLIAEYLIRRRA